MTDSLSSLFGRLPLASLVDDLRSRRTTPTELAFSLLRRLDEVNPRLHAFLHEKDRYGRLLSEARKLEEKYEGTKNEDLPKLYGVPVGVKDMFHAEGFETRAGSLLPAESLTGAEASMVTNLKRAGALVMGKTVTTEFAFFEPGPTRNPHHLEHTPGGSSSGSAAAVAAGICPLALGTQTIGSVSRPAAYCGIFGFKPSFDRIPTDGIFDFSKSVDHAGFFTQDLEGAALVASVVCDSWRDVPKTDEKPVIGVPTGRYLEQATTEIGDFFDEQVRDLEERGFTVKKIDLFPGIDEINTTHRAITAAEMALKHEKLFDEYRPLYRPKTRELILEGRVIPLKLLQKAVAGRIPLREKVEKTAKEEGIGLWLSPASTSTAPLGISATGSPSMNLPWTYLGLPTLVVPKAFSSNGLPMGLQLAGSFMKDEELLNNTGFFV